MKAGIRKIRRMMYILLGALLLFLPVSARGGEAPMQTQIELDVVYGFDNHIKSNSQVPVKVKLTCVSGRVVGKVQLEVPVQSDGNVSSSILMSDIEGRNNKEQCCVWEREVTLEVGESTEEVFYVELPMYGSYINVSVISENKILKLEQISCEVDENASRLFMGVISQNKAEISKLNGMQFHVDAYYTDEIFLRTIALTTEDIYEDPLGLEQLDILIVDKGTVFTHKQKNAIAIWESEGGMYFERVNESLLEILEYFQNGEESTRFKDMLDTVGTYPYYSENFDEIPLKEKVPIGKYIFLIILYLVVVGPGFYWLLKGKKEPYWLLGSVGIVACLFMVIIYLMGRSISMGKPAICHETILEQKGNYLKETINFSVQAYQMQDYVLVLKENYQILPKGIGMDGASEIDRQTAETITFGQEEGQKTILLEHMSAYRQKCFSMENYKVLPKDRKITFQICGNADALQIHWSNPTQYYLKQAVVVLENRLAILGEIKPFSEGNVEDAKLFSYSSSGMTEAFYDLLDFSEYDFPEYEIKNLVNTTWENLYGTGHSGETPFVIGILENPPHVFSDNRGFAVYGTSLMKIDVEVNWEKEQIRWCPNLEAYGTVYKGEYAEGLNLLESRDAIVDYPTSQIGKLLSLEFSSVDYNKQEDTTAFAGKIYLFNWQMGMYSEFMFWEHIPYGMSLDPYISDTGILRVYYIMEEKPANFNYSCTLPCIKVSGKVE